MKIRHICLDGSENEVIDNTSPRISWSVDSRVAGAYQSSCRVWVLYGNTVIWEHIGERKQWVRYEGPKPEPGCRYTVKVQTVSNNGAECIAERQFLAGALDWDAEWIASPDDKLRVPVTFGRQINCGKVRNAVLFVCGIGYHRVFINGVPVLRNLLAPSYTNYTKSCCYEVLEVGNLLREGENRIEVTVADGWRRPDSQFILDHIRRKIEFFGAPQLTAELKLNEADGCRWIKTDTEWECRHAGYTSSNLYDGTDYDETFTEEWVQSVPGEPLGRLVADAAEPVKVMHEYRPISIFSPSEGVFVADFGRNIAGVCRFKLPQHMTRGQKITISHAELLDEDGTLYTEPLRGVRAADSYTSAGGEYDGYFVPPFTYHGFRYACITGVKDLSADDITALAMYSSVESESFFVCGNPWINKIHDNSVQTERANIHGIFTDCPQRNERMCWINDTTVRFEETPYNFNCSRLLKKHVRDIMADSENGNLPYTAPYIYSARPADPICSSFFVSGIQDWLFNGSDDIINEAYDAYKEWQKRLIEKSVDGILSYTVNGDWASPAYCCVSDENARSAVTPGEFMSTGYMYYNACMIKRFAAILGRTQDEAFYADEAQTIRNAFLEKWFEPSTGKVCTGSNACQSFALWLDILPQEGRQPAADFLHRALEESEFMFTTGNMTTLYMLEVLTRYGYPDDAYTIMTREEYPSFGYMINNEATTIWERFELKKNPNMNSHNHPMYASVDKWMYAYLCGLKITGQGGTNVEIRPYFPQKLLSAQCAVETAMGSYEVKWVRRYGALHIYITVPFGAEAVAFLPENGTVAEHRLESGSYYFKSEDN